MNFDRSVFVILAVFLIIMLGILVIFIQDSITQQDPFTAELPPSTITVYLGSRPSGATVQIDGITQQYTTPAYFSITPVQHAYRISLHGYHDYISSFTLNRSTSQRVTFYMKPAVVVDASSQNKGTVPKVTSASSVPFADNQEQIAGCFRACGREYDLQIRECSLRYNVTNLSWVYDHTIQVPLREHTEKCLVSADMHQSDCSTKCYLQG
jgi:hypothetical protein